MNVSVSCRSLQRSLRMDASRRRKCEVAHVNARAAERARGDRRRVLKYVKPGWWLLSADSLIRVVELVDFVGMTYAKRLLIVDYSHILAGLYGAHLIRRFTVGREDLVEFRDERETERLFRLGVFDLDVAGRNVNDDAVERRRCQRGMRRHNDEGGEECRCGDTKK